MTISRVCAALLMIAVGVPVAHAWHIQGKIYCDANSNSLIDPSTDTPLNGIRVQVSSKTITDVRLDDSGDNLPASFTGAGAYRVDLADRIDDYKVELINLPAGYMIVLPVGGMYMVHLDTSLNSKDDANFLLKNCGEVTTTTTTTIATTTTTTTTTTQPCGNGTVDGAEQCDPPGSSCTGAFTGTCQADCRCPTTTTTTNPCGNGTVEGGEQCDPPGSSCTGAFTGTCQSDCRCPTTTTTTNPTNPCGNGTVEGGEQCDPPGRSCTGAFTGTCQSDCRCPTTTTTTSNSTTTTICVPTPEDCTNGKDDDCDLLIDCVDRADCSPLVPPCRIFRDPSHIYFGPPGAGRDYFRSHGRLKPQTPVNLDTAGVGWMLTNAQGMIYQAELRPGDLQNTGRQYLFSDNEARQGGPGSRGGVWRTRINVTSRGTVAYWIRAYGDMSRATDPIMTLQLHIGDQWFGVTARWRKTRRGNWIFGRELEPIVPVTPAG